MRKMLEDTRMGGWECTPDSTNVSLHFDSTDSCRLDFIKHLVLLRVRCTRRISPHTNGSTSHTRIKGERKDKETRITLTTLTCWKVRTGYCVNTEACGSSHELSLSVHSVHALSPCH